MEIGDNQNQTQTQKHIKINNENVKTNIEIKMIETEMSKHSINSEIDISDLRIEKIESIKN